MEKYHPNYNWIFANRPRNQAARAGFDGHLPSKDGPTDLIAILSEIRLGSRCHKLVHGQSGFVTLIEAAMRDAGNNNFTKYYLKTELTKEQAKAMGAGKARGDNMVRTIDEKMKAAAAAQNTTHPAVGSANQTRHF